MKPSEFRIEKSSVLSFPWEDRYIIIDAATGDVIDNCQGYGFKSVKTATDRALQRKHDTKRQLDKKEIKTSDPADIQQWLEQNKNVKFELREMAKFTRTERIVVSVQDIQEMLSMAGAKDMPFPVQDLQVYFAEHQEELAQRENRARGDSR